MTKDRSGEAFDRLRAADPAAGLEPDLAALRRAVTERETVVDELAARRRRPVRALQVAAAGAGALAIGAGGFLLGGGFAATSVASGESDGGALPAMTLDSGGNSGREDEAATSGEMAPEGGMGRGGGSRDMSEQAMTDSSYMPWPGGFGRTVFEQSGLSTAGTSSKAYGFDAESVHNEDTLSALAEALGIEGKVREEYGSLVVGPRDGSGPSISLYADGTASFNFHDPSKDPWFCAPDKDECDERDLGKAPQGDDAIEQASDFLVRLGADPADFELEATDESEFGSTDYSSVVAYRVIDGQRSGDQWGVSFTGGGVQSAWGSLAPFVDLGEYDVISPAEAVDRLGDPRFGVSSSSFPPGWMGPAGLERTVEDEFEVPSAPAPGDSFGWPVETVTIVSERLGLAQHHLGGGAVVLVPTYELSAADGRSWSVIAVTEAHLDFRGTLTD